MASLNLAEAEKIIEGCKAKMVGLSANFCVAVVDPRGDLIVFIRADGAPWRSTLISQGKANASAAWMQASAALTDNAQSPVSRGFMAMMDGRMIPGQGALPVYRNGEIIGAVGGSGGPSQEDEDVARAGIEFAGFSAEP